MDYTLKAWRFEKVKELVPAQGQPGKQDEVVEKWKIKDKQTITMCVGTSSGNFPSLTTIKVQGIDPLKLYTDDLVKMLLAEGMVIRSGTK